MAMSPHRGRFLWILLALSTLIVSVTYAANEKLPIHLPTDGAKWYGNDGAWSTVTLRLGNPAQIVYLLAGTSASITTTVGSVWCNDANSGYSCDSRGRSFVISESTTWKEIGQYELGIHPNLIESYLQYSTKDLGYGEFGRDTIKINNQDNRDLKMDQQTLAVVNDTTQLLGMLGLGVRSRSFSADEQYPSFVSTLYDTKTIPSRSWGYTAGNSRKAKGIPMDLVLGGKNLGRYTPNNVTFPLDANQNPTVKLASITVSATGAPPWGSGAETLMLEPALVLIDSTTPFLWLPEGACRQFEKALGLTWNETTNLYLMNDTDVYNGLLGLNLSFTFTLSSESGDGVVPITVPFSSFDLKISWPYINTTQQERYFPLKRSNNAQQYTLGRSFLQEAYLILDIDRGNFSVHQAIFPPDNDNIVPIISPSDMPAQGNTPTTPKKGSSLTTGALVGIAISAGLAVVAFIAGGFYLLHRNKKKEETPEEKETPILPEDDPAPIWEADGGSAAFKPLQMPTPITEMATDGLHGSRTELAAVNFEPAELSGDHRGRQSRFPMEETRPSRYRNTESPHLPELPATELRNDIQLMRVGPTAELSPATVSPLGPESRRHSSMSPISPNYRS